MDELGNMKHLNANGAASMQDEVDGAVCGKRRASDYRISAEPKAFETDVTGKLDVGKIIRVEGTIPFGVEVFQINLCCENSDDDVALHLSVRFKNRTVVRNTLQEGSWETEEKDGPFPFASGEEFSLHILVQTDSYYIAVNGQHCWVFDHRLHYSKVTTVNVIGPVKIHGIELHSSRNEHHPEASDTSTPFIQHVDNPSVPFLHDIPGGIKPGMKITVSGRPFVSVHKFTINLQCGTGPYPPPDIALHFDVRAYSHCVVRNTRRNNNWEKEEISALSFPFRPGVNFDIVISVESDKYVVTVHGKHFTDYVHRIKQLSSINTLRIENDVVIGFVHFE